MDPLTQGVLGVSLSQSASKKQHLVVAGVLGLLSGLAPDLDALIKSQSDPLLALEFHRQFTHSLFFIPILVLLVFATLKRAPWLARVAFTWALIYPTLGMIQRDRAEAIGWQLAQERQHTPIRLEAKPSFANILVWKVVYETEAHYHVDAVRVGTSVSTYPGESIAKLNVSRDLPWLDPDSQQAEDIERFRWFSNGYIAQDPTDELRIIDVRYSIVPNQMKALWSIKLSKAVDANAHVKYETHRDNTPESRQIFFGMLTGDK
ncbi:metal-dependent hydrolase [Vibrio sp. 10N.222.55.F12]|uniref:metal-dependent hydrolase n=1 Tax=Vibrio sp. 10N.222.55.F12 TaxID=3229653 RepID=UPI00354E5520